MDQLPLWLAASGVTLSGAVFAWGAVAPSAQLFGPTIRSTGHASTLGLTFDDGPNPAATPQLLDLLDRHNARATFFLLGKHVRAFPSLAKEIAQRGHAVGNHTEMHPRLTFLTSRKIEQQLARCDEAIATATGKPVRWMRPPFGYRGPQLDRVIRRRRGAGVVMWSVAARDWRPQPAARVIERLARVRGGDVVLLHDADYKTAGADRRHTIAALEHWIPRWKDAGFRFVSLDEF
jgi:peptidoglycan-N-acetylglucosamine deacetylase